MAKKGGQNPIEAALWGNPVIFGPYMYNFREIADIFVENNAAIKVKDFVQFKIEVESLFQDLDKWQNMSDRARYVLKKNKGALEKTIGKIGKYVSV